MNKTENHFDKRISFIFSFTYNHFHKWKIFFIFVYMRLWPLQSDISLDAVYEELVESQSKSQKHPGNDPTVVSFVSDPSSEKNFWFRKVGKKTITWYLCDGKLKYIYNCFI